MLNFDCTTTEDRTEIAVKTLELLKVPQCLKSFTISTSIFGGYRLRLDSIPNSNCLRFRKFVEWSFCELNDWMKASVFFSKNTPPPYHEKKVGRVSFLWMFGKDTAHSLHEVKSSNVDQKTNTYYFPFFWKSFAFSWNNNISTKDFASVFHFPALRTCCSVRIHRARRDWKIPTLYLLWLILEMESQDA